METLSSVTASWIGQRARSAFTSRSETLFTVTKRSAVRIPVRPLETNQPASATPRASRIVPPPPPRRGSSTSSSTPPILSCRRPQQGRERASHLLKLLTAVPRATKHHARATAHVLDVLERIRVEQDQVGALPDLDRPDLVRSVDARGRVSCRGCQDRRGRKSRGAHRPHLLDQRVAGHAEPPRRVGAEQKARPTFVERADHRAARFDLEGVATSIRLGAADLLAS